MAKKLAKKDYDKDGKIETPSQEYLGSKDKAIRKATGKNEGMAKSRAQQAAIAISKMKKEELAELVKQVKQEYNSGIYYKPKDDENQYTDNQGKPLEGVYHKTEDGIKQIEERETDKDIEEATYEVKPEDLDKVKSRVEDEDTVRVVDEDTDIGHVDDEPGMLKQYAYDIADYATKLYKLLRHYEQQPEEIDFPNWWQNKVMSARDYISKATHYLEFETMEPKVDAEIDNAPPQVDLEDGQLQELLGRVKNKTINYKGHTYKIIDVDKAGTFTLIDPKDSTAKAFYVNRAMMNKGEVKPSKDETEDVELNLQEAKATCCGKCGRVHVKGTECKRPFLTGKDHCRYN